jgi:predicted acyltransferase
MFWIIGGAHVFIDLAKGWKNPVTAAIQSQVQHVEWAGFHLKDGVFPLFLFVVGLVLPFSVLRRTQQGQSLGVSYRHIVKRSVILFLLGLIVQGDLLSFEWSQVRWLGVLQRIGICYFFAAVLVIHTRWQTQAIIAGAILILYWPLLMLTPVPGYGAGVLTAKGCLPTYIDNLLLPGRFYYGYAEPEGLLSTVPSICNVLFGVLAGHCLRSNRSGNHKAVSLAVVGVVLVTGGYIWGL